MSDPIQSGYVNWVDGMKMSRTHLLQLQQAVEDRFRDARTIHDPLTDHGLLGKGPGGEPALDLSITIEARSRYQVELRQCRAITPSGDRVELLGSGEPLRLTGEVPQQLMAEGSAFDLVIRAAKDVADPYGVPNPSESPIRNPFIRPEWTLELVPVKDTRPGVARNHLSIARLYVAKEELEQDDGHIPPALNMSGLPQLESFIREYSKFLRDVERDLMRIVVKLNVLKDHTELQEAVDMFCRSGLRFLETGMAPMLIMGSSIRPREVVMHAAQFARSLHHAIELLTGRGKEGLLDYVREHTGVKPSDHLATITGLMDAYYDHTDLRGALNKVTLFCRTHKKVFDLWVGLDYIGQKRDKDIFIAQDTVVPRVNPIRQTPPPTSPKPEKPTSGWDF